MTTEKFEARGLDVTKPTAARLYDYYLGGDAHYTVDKIFAERQFKICPYLDILAHHNRELLQRAIRYMAAECGIKQFLDIGSGIPTVGNTHHVAADVTPDARVVYVDKDQEAVNQSWELLARENATNATIIEGDLREPDSILNQPETQRLLDFSQPVGLVMIAVWHFISDDERPYELMERYRDQLAPGSYVAMTHASLDELPEEAKGMATAAAERSGETADPFTYRNRGQFTAFFDGLAIVDPGVVYASDWRPVEPVETDDPARPWNFAGVARKL